MIAPCSKPEDGTSSISVLGEEGVDALILVAGEAEVEGGREAFYLLRASSTNDGGCDGGMMERPGDGDNAGLDVVGTANFTQEFNQAKVAAEARLVELARATTPVVLREVGYTVCSHFACEKAGNHRGVVDDADVVGLREGQDLFFDGAAQHGIGRLKASNRCDFLRALHLLDVEIRDAYETDLALLFEFCKGLPAFFNLGLRIGPVDLVEVDGVAAETAERVVEFFFERFGFERAVYRAIVVPSHRALGEDVRLVAGCFQRLRNHFFRVAKTVDCGSVDPVDADLKGAMNGGDGFVVVLGTPGKLPVAPADSPCAEADGGEVKVGAAEGLEILCCKRGRSHNTWLDDEASDRVQTIDALEFD